MERISSLQLVPNALWDRMSIDLDKLAELVLSFKNTGWQESKPISYRKVGDTNEIVLGHRRTLAAVLAKDAQGETLEEIGLWLQSLVTTTSMVEVCAMCGTQVRATDTECPSCQEYLADESGQRITQTDEAEVVDSALFITNYVDFIHRADVEILAVEVSYSDDKAMLLDLVADNRMREDTDLEGLASAVKRLVKQYGANQRELAGLGIDANEVQFYMAISEMPAYVVEYIKNGQMAKSAAAMLMLKNSDQRQAVFNLLADGPVSLATLTSWLKKLREFQIPQPTLDASPLAYNQAMLLAAYSNDRLENDAVSFWMNVMTRNVVDITNEEAVRLCPELKCESCPLRGHLKDITPILSNPAYPCQKTSKTTYCLMHGSEVRADSRVTNAADKVYPDGSRWFSTLEVAKTAYGGLFQPQVDEEENQVSGERPIDAQRKAAAQWIAAHTTYSGSDHVVSSRCSECAWATPDSPTKDATVPHCLFEKGRNTIDRYVLTDEAGYKIPVCSGFTPTVAEDQFGTLIDKTKLGETHPEVIKHTVSQLLAVMETAGVPALTFLTGVPFSSNEPHSDWARKKIDTANLEAEQYATLVEYLTGEVAALKGGKRLIVKPSGAMGVFSRVKP